MDYDGGNFFLRTCRPNMMPGEYVEFGGSVPAAQNSGVRPHKL